MKIVACEIFRGEVESIAPELARRAHWLPAGLHVDLNRLGEAFGLEPLDEMEILEFFEYTQTPVEVVSAGLEHFRGVLKNMIGDADER